MIETELLLFVPIAVAIRAIQIGMMHLLATVSTMHTFISRNIQRFLCKTGAYAAQIFFKDDVDVIFFLSSIRVDEKKRVINRAIPDWL